MKFIYIYLLLLITLFASSCKKEKAIDLSGFDVKTDALTFNAGEEVTFHLNGDPAQLSFYSGETGNAYAFKDVSRVDKLDKLMFMFDVHNTSTDLGLDYSVRLSTDFNGIYDYENVSAAHWTDLSSRFHWAAFAPWQTGWESSGAVNISDVLVSGKPFYIAFKYVAPAIPTGTVPSRNWRTRAHILNVTTLYGYQIPLADFKGMAWKQVKKDPNAGGGSVVSSSIMLFSPLNTYRQEYEEWGVSKAFNVDEIDMGVDRGIPLKGYSDLPLTEFKHKYDTPGQYRVTFVASNTTAYNDKEVVKHIDITINPVPD